MAPSFSNLILGFFLLQFLLIHSFLAHSRTLKFQGTPSKFIQNLKGTIRKGQTVKGLKDIKHHLKNFGYYPNDIVSLSDDFDDYLESALKTYQKNYHLNVTGELDSDTIQEMMIPRCGVADTIINPSLKPVSTRTNNEHKFHANYAFFNGTPKWPPSKFHLAYRFIGDPNVIDIQTLRDISSRAFRRWEGVSHFTFEEASPGASSDLDIGFYRGAHGDGKPFDGPGKIFAHAFAPKKGWSHYDADENWNTADKPKEDQVDLESVVVHEIGHLLGLAHSKDKNAVMYAKLHFGAVKRDLTKDDIDGIHALYP